MKRVDKVLLKLRNVNITVEPGESVGTLVV